MVGRMGIAAVVEGAEQPDNPEEFGEIVKVVAVGMIVAMVVDMSVSVTVAADREVHQVV